MMTVMTILIAVIVMMEKEVDRGFIQTWENNARPEMHDSNARVKAMLEPP